jgi:hypothetical protein
MSLADWVVGTIGLSSFFGEHKIKITKHNLAQALQEDKIIAKRAKEWAASNKPAKFIPPKLNNNDYDRIVSSLHVPQVAQPDISQLDPDSQLDVLAGFIDISNYLAEKEPAVRLSGGFISREIEPPDSDKSRFMWSCNIINDVTSIFDLLDSGALTAIEAEVFRELFPDLAMKTAKAYITAAIDYVYYNKKPTIASWQAVGLSALMGAHITDFQDVIGWQMNYDGGSGPGRPSGPKAPNLSGANITDSQKLGEPK